MKTSTLFRGILMSAAVFGAASFVQAGPGPQYWETLHQKAQFEQLKPGERLAYVCKECNTISELPAGSPAQAMELCKEGATVTCPVCKKTTEVVRKQSRNDPPSHTEIVYVNDKGEECAFVAKIPDKK